MSELVTLTAPIPKPSQTIIRLDRVILDATNSSVSIQWLGDNGEPGSAFYPTPPPNGSSQPSGATVLHVLNTSNFTTTSFVKRVLQQLQTDGYVPAGTISGTPV